MKMQNLTAAAILAAITLTSATTMAASYFVGVSPNYAPPDRETVFKQILLFVLEGASAGDEILIYDALHQQPVTSLLIPEGQLFQVNGRARAQRLKSEISTLRKFLLSERPYPSDLAGVIHAPQFLDLAGPQLRKPGQASTVILIGSPFYMDSDELFNMNDAYPSDGNILGDQSVSLFGTALRKKALVGVTVHYSYLRECFLNDFHRERIARFWSLFIKQQEGILATFAPDISLAFQRAVSNVRQPCVDARLDLRDTKVEMRHVTPRSIPVWFGPTNLIAHVRQSSSPSSSEANISANPQSPVVLPTPPTNLATAQIPVVPTQGTLGIGIMWAVPVDCDLYVRATPNSPELCYRNRISKEGRYFHDYVTRNDGLDFEYVELKSPADLDQVGAWVNLFSGNSPAVSGIVAVYYRGQSYRGEFRVQASSGNSGLDGNNRRTSPHWTELDLRNIIGLNTPAVSPIGQAAGPPQ